MTDAEAMLQDCNKRYSKLTNWECSFIDNLLERDRLDNLSPQQYQTLEEIWERIT